MWYNDNASADFSRFGRKTDKKPKKTKKIYIKGELES